MGFFSSKSKNTQTTQEVNTTANTPKKETISTPSDIIKTPTRNVSTIKENFKVKADIEGDGSLILGGHFEGNIKLDDTLYIEKGAKFFGEVHAKNVKISGDFEGKIFSIATEVTKSGRLNGSIETNKAFLGGFVNGVVNSIDSIEILSTGIVDTKECKSKQIKIVGKVEGKVVASELLEVTSGGAVKGDIITKGIRTEQGGSIIGNIQTYDESIHAQSTNTDTKETPAEIDPEVAKLIDIKPEDIQKYAKKDDEKGIKRIPADKK